MEADNENRSRWIKVRLKPSEEQALNKKFKKSTFQNLSEYGRALILGEPVTILHRDRSMDEILEELVLLRRELNAIGSNLNQAVRNINSDRSRTNIPLWDGLLAIINGRLEPAINEIKERMNKYSDLWSQKLKAEKA